MYFYSYVRKFETWSQLNKYNLNSGYNAETNNGHIIGGNAYKSYFFGTVMWSDNMMIVCTVRHPLCNHTHCQI